jgi:hypothetical protein
MLAALFYKKYAALKGIVIVLSSVEQGGIISRPACQRQQSVFCDSIKQDL